LSGAIPDNDDCMLGVVPNRTEKKRFLINIGWE